MWMSTEVCITIIMRAFLSAYFKRPISSAPKHVDVDRALRDFPNNWARSSPQAFLVLGLEGINSGNYRL